MATKFTAGLRTGLVFGGVLVFFDLIGFSTTVTGVLPPILVFAAWAALLVTLGTGKPADNAFVEGAILSPLLAVAVRATRRVTLDARKICDDLTGLVMRLIGAGLGGGLLVAIFASLT